MNEAFYKPLVTNYHDKPVIIYLCNGSEKVFDRDKMGCVEKYLLNLFDNQPKLTSPTNQYFIIITWEMNSKKMVDIWIHGEFESSVAGPSVGVMNFNDSKFETGGDITAGDGLIMLGREEECRRKATNFDAYIQGPRPTLPEGINPIEDFYI